MTPLTILLWYFLFFILLFKTWNVCSDSKEIIESQGYNFRWSSEIISLTFLEQKVMRLIQFHISLIGAFFPIATSLKYSCCFNPTNHISLLTVVPVNTDLLHYCEVSYRSLTIVD